MDSPAGSSRRRWLANSCGLVAGTLAARPIRAAESPRARIAVTLDLEMARNFPVWEATHWDYEKGNLDADTKRYAVEAARRVKAAGGLVHFFAVGSVLEQPDVAWLAEIAAAGHPIGNHTYDHVNMLATRPEDVQFRFQRSPWLLRGMPVAESLRENVRLASEAVQTRLGIAVNGFRTPGGFHDGLRERPDVRALLSGLGFRWVSSLYPPHPNSQPHEEPDDTVLRGIVEAQRLAQPFVYPDGLVEIPMSPISDIGAFRNGRWRLDWFLASLSQCLAWTIEHGAVFDFLGHPACLHVMDPEFRAIDLICGAVAAAGDRAEIVGLDTIAAGVRAS